MGCPIRPSNVRVYQFHHDGTGTILWLRGTPGRSGRRGSGGRRGGGSRRRGGRSRLAGGAAFGAAEAGKDFGMTDPFGFASMIERIIEMATKPTNAPVVTLCRN